MGPKRGDMMSFCKKVSKNVFKKCQTYVHRKDLVESFPKLVSKSAFETKILGREIGGGGGGERGYCYLKNLR